MAKRAQYRFFAFPQAAGKGWQMGAGASLHRDLYFSLIFSIFENIVSVQILDILE